MDTNANFLSSMVAQSIISAQVQVAGANGVPLLHLQLGDIAKWKLVDKIKRMVCVTRAYAHIEQLCKCNEVSP